MVALNRIYTRTGDKGTTALASGERRPKYDLRIAAFGTVDETNACIGMARLHTQGHEVDAMLARIQNDLFDLGADLSVPGEVEGRLRIEQPLVDRLEEDCDRLNADLPELKSFVLPGGTAAAAGLHVARTICRRAERETLRAAHDHRLGALVAVYLNRLSDLLFILARAANHLADRDEPLWKPGATRR